MLIWFIKAGQHNVLNERWPYAPESRLGDKMLSFTPTTFSTPQQEIPSRSCKMSLVLMHRQTTELVFALVEKTVGAVVEVLAANPAPI